MRMENHVFKGHSDGVVFAECGKTFKNYKNLKNSQNFIKSLKS